MSDSESKSDEKKVVTIKNAADLQRLRIEKLMKNPEKPVLIPERPKDKALAPPPDFVRNVMGSSAGAGSGEFHVYRHLRRKEYARQKFIQEKSEKEKLDEEYHRKLEENKRKAEEKTAKKRAKRLRKKKNAKLKGKQPKKNNQQNVSSQSDSSSESENEESEESKEKSESGEQKDLEVKPAAQKEHSNSSCDNTNDNKIPDSSCTEPNPKKSEDQNDNSS